MLRFSLHAEQRLQQRGITKAEVEEVVKDPEVSYPDGKGNRSLVRDVGDKTIRVVVSGADPEFVITVIAVTNQGAGSNP